MWNIEAETGYKSITTFWEDFSIADRFGKDAVQDTYNRAFSEWKDNCKYVTELVLVLNWKIWQHAKGNPDLGRLYDKLWRTCDEWCVNNLKGDDAEYYYRTTD